MSLCPNGASSSESWPDVGNAEDPCCYGSALSGPGGCTCWMPVFDLEQQPPRTDLEPDVQAGMCPDCAYRPNSPERRGVADAATDEQALLALVESGSVFWCHRGMRRPTHWQHPFGATTPASPLNYQPPIHDGRPYKADGTPGDLCAGWTALRLKAMQRSDAG